MVTTANISEVHSQELVIDDLTRIEYLIQVGEFESAIKFANTLDDSLNCGKSEILGFCYLKLENYEAAVNHYKKYIDQCNPSYIQRINLGDSYFKIDSLDLAEEQFLEIVKSKPTYGLAYYNLGQIEYKRGNKENAAGHFLKAINNTGGVLDFDFVEMMIKTLNDLKNYENALLIADQVISMWDEDADEYKYSLILKASIYGDMGNYQQALEELERIIALKIENPVILAEAYIHKIDIYTRLGYLHKACEEYHKLKKIDPKSVWLEKMECE